MTELPHPNRTRRPENVPKGVWAVAAVFVVYAGLYWSHVIAAALPFQAQFSYFVGSCSVICMVLGLLLSTRPRAVETSLGGLDRMYKLHKVLGVAALALFLAHYATVPGGPEEEEVPATAAGSVEGELTSGTPDSEEEEEDLPIDLFGMVAMIGFTVLILLTLNRKIPYHRWIVTHRFMGVFFVIVVVHVSLVLYDGEEIALFSAPGLFLGLLLLAGLGGVFYKQVLFPNKKKHRFTLAVVNRLERATEVVLRPQEEMFSFEPGQFAFITIDKDGFREAHPFTISSGAKEDRLRFTMKVLGDYTRRIRDALTAGAEVAVEGPYGRFNPLKGLPRQVWVAGGIGITPFLSVLRTMEPNHGRTIRLFYCVRTAREALFFGELQSRAAQLDGVTVTLFDSDAGVRINTDGIRTALDGPLEEWSYFLCGPKPMIAALSQGLRKQGVPRRRVHREEFEFR